MGFQQNPDYITVAERIVEFRTKYPKGSLQPWDPAKPYTLDTINGNPVFVVVAAAYREPGDERPGIGMAYEPIPGSTPYTRGSELQNAETAAWGRAIVAVLAADTNRGIASMEEVAAQEAREAQTQRAPQQQRASQQQQPPAVDYSAWTDAIEERKGDRDQLLALYNEAKAKRVPGEIIAQIKAAGDAVARPVGQRTVADNPQA